MYLLRMSGRGGSERGGEVRGEGERGAGEERRGRGIKVMTIRHTFLGLVEQWLQHSLYLVWLMWL